MFLACVLLLFGPCLAIDIHNGMAWDEVKDPRWPTPSGAVYQVSSSSDINNLQSTLRAGDTMVMRNGEWKDTRITLSASGSSGSGNMIYLVPATLGSVKLTGKVQITISGRYIEVRGLLIEGTSSDKLTPVTFSEGSSRSRFTNCAIDNFNRATDPKAHHWIEIWGSYHTIDYVSLENKKSIGQLVRVKTTNDDHKPPGGQPDSWGHTIKYNYFGPRADTTQDNGEGIQIGLKESEWVKTEILVERNYFYRYDAEVESISVKGTNNTIRWNTFRESASLVTLRHTDNTRVQENYFYCGGKSRCGGVRIYGEDHVVINNYIEGATANDNNRAGIISYAGNPNDPYIRVASNNQIVRNLCYKCVHGLYWGRKRNSDATTKPKNNYFEKNLLTGRTSSDICYRHIENDSPTWIINNVHTCTVDRTYDGIRVKDPKFVYDSQFEIQKPTDADFEFSMKYPPIKRADVGPTWRS